MNVQGYRFARRRIRRVTFLLGLALCCYLGPGNAQSLALRTAETHPYDYPTSVALRFLSERLSDLSAGEVELKIYTGGQLGEEKDVLELTILGGIDVSRVSLAPLNSIALETTVLAMPFLFRSTEHMRSVLDGPIGKEILSSLESRGLVGLAYYDSGARSIYNTRRPIHIPKDIEGLKIRVQNSDVAVAMVEALGGNPTPMGFGQVYESLMLGAIDGSENNWPSYDSAGHFEVARHYTLTRHTMVPEVLVISKYRWDQLDAKERANLHQAAAESVSIMREEWDARVKQSRDQLLASGVELVDNVDTDAFIEAVAPVYDRFMDTPELQNLVSRIRAVGRTP